MNETQIIKFIDDELQKADGLIEGVKKSKSWIDQGSLAKKALEAQQKVLAAVVKMLKEALIAD